MNIVGKIEHQALFSVPFFATELDDFEKHQPGIVQRIKALQAKQPGLSHSNRHGWHSDNYLHNDSDPHIKWLFDHLGAFAVACAKHAKGKEVELSLYRSWANINPAGAWNMPHSHMPAHWSGVAYLQVEPNQQERDGDLILIDPFPVGHLHGRENTLNLRATPGKAFLWPAYLMHMVSPHQSSTDRISVAFNFAYAANPDGE
jgi:uncharacterized protein (TIGR02466 family)